MLTVACSSAPAPSDLPIPTPTTGWTSIGAVQADASDGWIVSRHTFSGRPASIHASCQGNGTLFVIVGWSDFSMTAGPARVETVAFPCLAPVETLRPVRIDLTEAPTGPTDVSAFIVEGLGATSDVTYAVSVEERDP
jgi:hypothetical protein